MKRPVFIMVPFFLFSLHMTASITMMETSMKEENSHKDVSKC